MLSMLIRLMLAQAQECLFEKIALPGIRNQFYSLMKVAQEAAKVNFRKATHSLSHYIQVILLFLLQTYKDLLYLK